MIAMRFRDAMSKSEMRRLNDERFFVTNCAKTAADCIDSISRYFEISANIMPRGIIPVAALSPPTRSGHLLFAPMELEAVFHPRPNTVQ